jgi:hypothetical protein
VIRVGWSSINPTGSIARLVAGLLCLNERNTNMIELEANYSKKLGLPGYSSHQYSLTVRKEVADISQVENESRQLFATLQSNVDRDIQQTGFLPQANGATAITTMATATVRKNGSAQKSNAPSS